MPAVRRGALPGSVDWALATMQPGGNPFDELEAALLRAAVNPPATIMEQLTSGRTGLLRATKRLVPDNGGVLLVIDQLEELWTHVPSDEERGVLLDSIVEACSQTRSPLHVLATLRADFVDQALQHSGFAELFRVGTVLLPPLKSGDIERAVRGPSRRSGWRSSRRFSAS